MLPNGSYMKICRNSGPHRPQGHPVLHAHALQLSALASWISATASGRVWLRRVLVRPGGQGSRYALGPRPHFAPTTLSAPYNPLRHPKRERL
jgi:hypothetical protein